MKPKLCVLTNNETQCNDQFKAQWQAREQLSLCIFQDNKAQPIECWENAAFGNTHFTLMLTQSTAFELRETKSQKVVARQQFDIVYEQKKYSKNRRNPWSFF